jgi:hypothetical protein
MTMLIKKSAIRILNDFQDLINKQRTQTSNDRFSGKTKIPRQITETETLLCG